MITDYNIHDLLYFDFINDNLNYTQIAIVKKNKNEIYVSKHYLEDCNKIMREVKQAHIPLIKFKKKYKRHKKIETKSVYINSMNITRVNNSINDDCYIDIMKYGIGDEHILINIKYSEFMKKYSYLLNFIQSSI